MTKRMRAHVALLFTFSFQGEFNMPRTPRSRADLLAEISELKSENESLADQNEGLLDRLDQIGSLADEIEDEADTDTEEDEE
jgi:hypothetical protein